MKKSNRFSRKIKAVYLMIALSIGFPAFAQTENMGIVLMHGKEGRPGRIISSLADELRNKKYLVATPEMPWSYNRIYDATVEDTYAEIDKAVRTLREKGAKRIVVAGHSMGANAALSYAIDHKVDGIIMLAAGHSPEVPRLKNMFSADLTRAREMIASGKGSEKTNFTDVNKSSFTVVTTPLIYVSWFDPEGLANMPKNTEKIKAPLPVLFVVGESDRVPASVKHYIYDKMPPHPRSKYAVVPADHLGVPAVSAKEVINWLEAIAQ